MSELISVIIPIYNAEKHLKRCIESILEQSYSNLEILLINDGSKDGSKDICDEFAQKDNRIVVLHKENEGVGRARNDGLKKATGKYIAFVDSDDYLDKNSIEILYNALIENNVDCVKGNYDIVTKTGIIQNNEPKIDKKYDKENINEFLYELLTERTKSFLWLLLIKKECIKDNFCEELFLYEDVNFYLSFLGNINSIYVFSKITYHYVIMNQSSLSRDINKVEEKVQNLMLANSILKNTLNKYGFDNDTNIKAIDTSIINNIINYYYYKYKNEKKFKDTIKSFENIKNTESFNNMLENYDDNILSKKARLFNDCLISKKYFRFWLLCKVKNILAFIRR